MNATDAASATAGKWSVQTRFEGANAAMDTGAAYRVQISLAILAARQD